MFKIPPRPAQPQEPPATITPGEGLTLIGVWLREECEWLSSLTRELSAVRQVIGTRFLDESLALIQEHRDMFQSLLPKLLALELDITAIGQQLAEFDALHAVYRELAEELKARR